MGHHGKHFKTSDLSIRTPFDIKYLDNDDLDQFDIMVDSILQD